jgi:hypothetical protein
LAVVVTIVIVLCTLIILAVKVGRWLARRAEQRRTAAPWQQPYQQAGPFTAQQPFGYYGPPTTPGMPYPPNAGRPPATPVPPPIQQPPTWNYPDQR